MTTKEIKIVMKAAWNDKTCYPFLVDKWTKKVPEMGQCAVTALVIQDHFGGLIAYNKHLDHYWNLLDTGDQIDLTRKQFRKRHKFNIDEVKSREELLSTDRARQFKTQERYRLLRIRISIYSKTLVTA